MITTHILAANVTLAQTPGYSRLTEEMNLLLYIY